MEMSYKQLEKTLLSYFSILPDREATFRSRIKQLQRLEFPPGINVGRGVKMAYAGGHLLQLIVAFELIALGVPAQTSTQIVQRHWETIARATALASLAHRYDTKKLGADKKDKIFVEFILRGLYEIQFRRLGWSNPKPSSAYIVDGDCLSNRFGRSAERPLGETHPTLLLCMSDIIHAALKLATEQAGVQSANVYDDEIMSWLPTGDNSDDMHIRGAYPDRANLQIRRNINLMYKNDPESETEVGQTEAEKFRQVVHLKLDVEF